MAKQQGWQLIRLTEVQSKAGQPPIRCLLSLQRCTDALEQRLIASTLCIADAEGHYTAAYRDVLRDFYLKF
ncbi:MAG: methyltransferase, partial [Alkalimonas sp.]|nr:methyltransferase [Alkalimonas sp.]